MRRAATRPPLAGHTTTPVYSWVHQSTHLRADGERPAMKNLAHGASRVAQTLHRRRAGASPGPADGPSLGGAETGRGDRDTKQKALQINDSQGLCCSGGRCRVRTCDPCHMNAISRLFGHFPEPPGRARKIHIHQLNQYVRRCSSVVESRARTPAKTVHPVRQWRKFGPV
jgi:hypothetical protein